MTIKLCENIIEMVKDHFDERGEIEGFCPVCSRERVKHQDFEAKLEEIIDALKVHGWLNQTEIQELVGKSSLTREAIYYLKSDRRLVYDLDINKYGLSEHENKEISNQEREEYGN